MTFLFSRRLKMQRELCVLCDGETERAGRYDDSIFCETADGSDTMGPLCMSCYWEELEKGTIVDE